MNKFATLTIAIAALSVSAMAGTVTSNCTAFPIQFANSIGSGNVTCAAFSGNPGDTLTGVSLNLYADYSFGTAVFNDIKLTFNIGAPGGVTWATTSTSIDATGGFSSSNTSSPLPVVVAATAGATNANFAAPFQVGVSSSVVSGGAGTSSAGVQVTYTYSSPTPEPATTAMMGAGLIAIATFGRKRLAGK